jgi:ATP-dependent Clp protease ATP-binding subunit ClpA
VPLSLRSVRLLSLDHVALLAGTSYRGQYEERIRVIVADTSAAGDVILFIDELHNLIGQGTAMGAAMDAANMLKPALVRGDFRVIGATTSDEYERWIEGDPALERRFQKVVVRELGVPETLEILHARKERLERHHNVLISDEALRASVTLTDAYVTDRMRPDKAIDALDEACAHLQAVTEFSPAIEELIRRRLALLRSSTRNDRDGDTRDSQSASASQSREPFSALERFGAEIEALFGGPPVPEPVGGPAAPTGPRVSAQPPTTTPAAESLAPVEAELSRRLMEEGVVIRGHDVARVVGLMAGTDVRWEPDAA